MKTQHSGQDLKCKYCEYKTNGRVNLDIHIKRKHVHKKILCSQCEHTAHSKKRPEKACTN